VHLYQRLKSFSLPYNCTITGMSVSSSMSINLRTDTQLQHLKQKLCEVTVLLEKKKTPLMRSDTNPLILARQGGIRSRGYDTGSFCTPPKFRNKSDNIHIYSVHFDSIKLFIRDINKCTFDIHKYSFISLLHISASLIPHDLH
jgi:hypothetical protein